ncbi:permease [Paenibacillus pini JCM 16418]|uniref:Permease n=2 Tax=Paenibacillus TaxID=44249 RepID=W7YIN0_9BACL|nr:permease [Paenibacillus pini JCM 16418]
MGSLLNRNALGSLLYLIVIGSMVGHSLFYWLVAKTNPMFPTTWLYVSPMIAMGVGYLFYHEKVSGISMAGMITIIVGTLIANLDSFNQYIRRSKKMQRSSVLEEGNTRWKVTK